MTPADAAHAAGTAVAGGHRLRIGLSSCFFAPDPDRPVFKGKTLLYVEQSMAHWVAEGGALVYPVPTVASPDADGPAGPDGPLPDVQDPPGVAEVVGDLDGLVLHGGSDVAPGSYGEQPLRPEWSGDAPRDAYERTLVEAFLAADKPVLGICRGHQILNVTLGGTLYQDLIHQGVTERAHRDQERYDRNRHGLEVEAGGYLAEVVGGGHHDVNSVHHQAIKDLAPDLVVEARSADDGVVEAVRLARPGAPWCVGVQWHPEFVPPERDGLLDDRPLRAAFLAAARARRDRSGASGDPDASDDSDGRQHPAP